VFFKRAVHDYFDLSGDMEEGQFSQKSTLQSGSESGNTSSHTLVDAEPNRIRVLSWNIDGLDQNNIATRAKSVCQIISG